MQETTVVTHAQCAAKNRGPRGWRKRRRTSRVLRLSARRACLRTKVCSSFLFSSLLFASFPFNIRRSPFAAALRLACRSLGRAHAEARKLLLPPTLHLTCILQTAQECRSCAAPARKTHTAMHEAIN